MGHPLGKADLEYLLYTRCSACVRCLWFLLVVRSHAIIWCLQRGYHGEHREWQAGSTTLFWKDLWCNQTLCDSHPRAFSFAKNEDILIQALLTSNTLGEAFHLPLSMQAREEVWSLQLLTTEIDPSSDARDEWVCVWGNNSTKGLVSRKFYKHCFSSVHVDDAFAWIWRSKCTNKWKVFCWLLLADRLNTRNILHRRHYVLADDVDDPQV